MKPQQEYDLHSYFLCKAAQRSRAPVLNEQPQRVEAWYSNESRWVDMDCIESQRCCISIYWRPYDVTEAPVLVLLRVQRYCGLNPIG